MSHVTAFMTKGIVTAEPDENVASVARRMAEEGVGAVFLLNGKQTIGVFTERDLLTRVVAKGHDPAQVAVGDVATREVVGVPLDAPLRRCAEELRRHDFRHLPVEGPDGAVGVISSRDFFQAVAGRLAGLLERRAYDAELREGFDPYDHLGGGYGR